jgi:hypothetical protein
MLGLAMMTSPANALTLMPGDADLTSFPDLSTVTLEYVQVNGGAESGNLAGSYSTAFGTISTGGAFNISYDGVPDPSVGCPLCALLVKGTQGQELVFLLNSWNGTEIIQGRQFGASSDLIAGVAIVSRAVPEPASLMLLGAGLVGVGIWRRRLSTS